MSIQNQSLLWTIYIRPYYLYLSSVIKTQRLSVQQNFHTSWRMSLKQFVGLPRGTPNKVLSTLFEHSLATTDAMNDKNIQKINRRFGTCYPTQHLQLAELKNLKYLPNNFTRLFKYTYHKCSCHHLHLTIEAILNHNNTSLDEFLSRLLNTENNDPNENRPLKCYQSRLLRRRNEREIDHLLELANASINESSTRN